MIVTDPDHEGFFLQVALLWCGILLRKVFFCVCTLYVHRTIFRCTIPICMRNIKAFFVAFQRSNR